MKIQKGSLIIEEGTVITERLYIDIKKDVKKKSKAMI